MKIRNACLEREERRWFSIYRLNRFSNCSAKWFLPDAFGSFFFRPRLWFKILGATRREPAWNCRNEIVVILRRIIQKWVLRPPSVGPALTKRARPDGEIIHRASATGREWLPIKKMTPLMRTAVASEESICAPRNKSHRLPLCVLRADWGPPSIWRSRAPLWLLCSPALLRWRGPGSRRSDEQARPLFARCCCFILPRNCLFCSRYPLKTCAS